MAKFDWRIDSANYLSGGDKKITIKQFIKVIVDSLNDYRKYEMEELLAGKVDHCHTCPSLEQKKSPAAKKLVKHLETINAKLGQEGGALELSRVLQLKIKGYPGRPEFRCYGYVDGEYFYLVYLDPQHEVYKE